MYPTPTRLEIIAGVLRLSHKYSVDYLRRRALVHLSSAFFTTLSAVDDDLRAADSSLWTRPSWGMSSESRRLSISHAIQLAREVGALWVLPYAFYELAQICAKGPDILTCLKPGNLNGVSTQLSEEDQIAFVKGYCVQISTSTSGILRFLQEPASIPGCNVGYDCLLVRLTASAESDRHSSEYLADPLVLWYGSDWERLAGVCGTCLKSLKRTHQSARRTFWDQLPQMYGLPGWEELEKMKADALGTA